MNKLNEKRNYTHKFIIYILLNSCCFSAKENHLGNKIYLSEYDNIDRRILYQDEPCATGGIQIVPMTVIEISHNSEWIIAKSGNKRANSNFKYWVIKNKYKTEPTSDTVLENTMEFSDYEQFKSYIKKNRIKLNLKKIE